MVERFLETQWPQQTCYKPHVNALKETEWYKNSIQVFMDAGIQTIRAIIDLSVLFPRGSKMDSYGGHSWQMAYFADHVGFQYLSKGNQAMQVCSDLLKTVEGTGYKIVEIGPYIVKFEKEGINEQA